MNPTILGALIAAGSFLLGSIVSAILNHVFAQRQTRVTHGQELRKLAIEAAIQSWRDYHSKIPHDRPLIESEIDERYSLSFHLREISNLITPDRE